MRRSFLYYISYISLILLFSSFSGKAQQTLNADGPGDTYELINSVLAPGYNVIEAPDCAHPEFGRHIDEVHDDFLNKYVFRFHIHVTPDNDRCKNFDRQRNEIKSYDKSPSSLKAVEGETVLYEWKFKIDSFFQSSSSFTHLHQLKAVGGSEESMPLITFTTRKGSPDKLELRYAKNTSQTTLKKVDLTPFKGNWISVKELVTYGEEGRYSVLLTRIGDNEELFSYSSTNIRMWKTDATFIRPKWGIYRSLNNAADLRDEMIYFSDFSITEGDISLSTNETSIPDQLHVFPNPASVYIQIKSNIKTPISVEIFDHSGKMVHRGISHSDSRINIAHLTKGVYFIKLISNDKEMNKLSRFIKL